MTEGYKRRDLLKYAFRATVGAAVVSAGADVAHSVRFWSDSPEVTPEAREQLTQIVTDMSSHITPSSAFSVIDHNGETYQPELNPSAAAAMLAYLAYADGGINEAIAVGQYVREQGLLIGEGTMVEDGRMILPTHDKPSAHILLRKNLIREFLVNQTPDRLNTVPHELYHVVQLGRRESASVPTRVMDQAGDLIVGMSTATALFYGSTRASARAIDRYMLGRQRQQPSATTEHSDTDIDHEKRKTLAVMAGAVATVGLSYMAAIIIKPRELQAYVQAGGLGEGSLTSRIPEGITNNLFAFKPLRRVA